MNTGGNSVSLISDSVRRLQRSSMVSSSFLPMMSLIVFFLYEIHHLCYLISESIGHFHILHVYLAAHPRLLLLAAAQIPLTSPTGPKLSRGLVSITILFSRQDCSLNTFTGARLVEPRLTMFTSVESHAPQLSSVYDVFVSIRPVLSGFSVW